MFNLLFIINQIKINKNEENLKNQKIINKKNNLNINESQKVNQLKRL